MTSNARSVAAPADWGLSWPLSRLLPRALVGALVGLLTVVALTGLASAQADESAAIGEPSEYIVRDARIAFDRRTAEFARFDLVDLEPGDHGRAAALVALGASGSVQGRAILVDETAPGAVVEERVAAVLGLGEMGSRVGNALDVLLGATRDDEPAVVHAAVVALVRCGLKEGRERVDQLRTGDEETAKVARQALAHQIDPERSEPPAPYRLLYELRWEAGRTYGIVDGKVWSSKLMDELATNMAFLDGLVMRLTVELRLDKGRDHMLEILTQGEGAQRVIAAAQFMPFEVEAMIDAGAWRPADDKEWKWLALTILHEELQAYYPHALAQSIGRPVARWIAAGLLYRQDSQFEDILQEGLRDEDPRNRAYTAYTVGAADLADYIPRLHEQTDDADAWAAANALGSLIRMGSGSGAQKAIDLLALHPSERRPFLSSYLFEVLYRAAPDADVMKFVEEVAKNLTGVDRASADSILLLHGIRVDSASLRAELPLMNPVFPEAIRGARGLGKMPTTKDMKLLARLFPREKAPEMNLEIAVALARAGHRAPEPLLEAAVWKLPYNQSVLAAGCVMSTYGEPTLLTWITNPPAGVTDEDIRRLGFAIGEWGGLAAVERLRSELGTSAGAELPALQGAILGALASRTR